MNNVLVVDDEVSICETLKNSLELEGYGVDVARTLAVARKLVAKNEYALLLLDIILGEKDNGLDFLPEVQEMRSDMVVVMMSAHGDISTAVTAIHRGALDFLEKPVALERLLVSVQNAMEIFRLRRENSELKKPDDTGMMGESPALLLLLDSISRVAPTDARVLITGPNGSGKERAAAAIFHQSQRAAKPFIRVNCAAIPDPLLEAELFGYDKGAFTGAEKSRAGKFEEANLGTIFLDEIGDLSAPAQAKVLRVIQEGELSRLGSSRVVKIDVRILAATNKDLAYEVRAGTFREDLYYRLNVIPIRVPSLAERTEDIVLLFSYFLRQFAEQYGLPLPEISPPAVAVLLAYDWPGNVRELSNIAERILILGNREKALSAVALRQALGGVVSPVATVVGDGSLKDRLEETERLLIAEALATNEGKVSLAATALGVERTLLYKKIRKYKL